ncbi:type II toxin-antitoxin system VapC family toxin [Methylobacterium currus]|uniref:type II toxin-antitoxin system VapC family toxin n=1 Tax=Methylobacterium currus TaxID=2051553 RepID=UPI001E5F38E8|nr:type II toxin-antitoxin system VapC family toxin [Methylobacterium currus]UHC18456.1 type II toxin-antitoxin system VapC family toxin [Methylobacterium currus]
MSGFVLDASAPLALLRDEPGVDRVKAVIDGAAMGAVNWAEVVSHYAKLGAARSDIEATLRPLPIRVVPADADLSVFAGTLRPITLPLGSSLGDRDCLALAGREAATALTADRRRRDIAAAAAVAVESIR